MLQKKLTADSTTHLISSISTAMLNDIETNRSRTIGDKSLPVSLTMQGVAEGSTASVTTEDGSFDLPNTMATTSAVAQVNFDLSLSGLFATSFFLSTAGRSSTHGDINWERSQPTWVAYYDVTKSPLQYLYCSRLL